MPVYGKRPPLFSGRRYQYKREPLTVEERLKLENACQTYREKLIVFGLLDTGLRVSEFCAIKRLDVDWQNSSIRVHGKGGPFGKESKVRAVPLSERAKNLFDIYLSGAKGNAIDFTTKTAQREVESIARKASIAKRVTPHVLRHTFAVEAIKKGISLRALQQVMGHDHITTTEIYLNYGDKNALDEFKKKWE
jgi:integrase/recombinase XerD